MSWAISITRSTCAWLTPLTPFDALESSGPLVTVLGASNVSYEAKKKSLSLMIGPPRVAPHVSSSKLKSISSPVSGFSGVPAHESCAFSKKALPWKSLVPDLVTTFIFPPEKPPSFAENGAIATLIWSIES